MKSPFHKPIEYQDDALKVYKKQVESKEQLRAVFDGLKWLIANNYEKGEHLRKNYYVIKSSETLPVWHKERYDIASLPPIAILYSVHEDKIIIEGINLRSK